MAKIFTTLNAPNATFTNASGVDGAGDVGSGLS
jgi:hypothetical protein